MTKLLKLDILQIPLCILTVLAFIALERHAEHYADLKAAAAVGMTPASAARYYPKVDNGGLVKISSQPMTSYQRVKAMREVWNLSDRDATEDTLAWLKE